MRKLISALVFGALLIPDYALTLGMGDIEVNSALNQQLDARIELLSAVPEDAETMIVKLASREEFSRAGLDRPYGLTSLRFKPVTENGRVFIEVSSPKPIREPFLNFLVEVDWPKGHLLREYTILLDPPVFMGQQPAGSSRPASRPSSAAPAPVQSSAQAGGRPAAASGFRSSIGSTSAEPVAKPASEPASQPARYEPEPVAEPQYAAPVAAQSQSFTPPSGGYRVKQGDTAWSLADSLRPDQSISVQQMMLAMLRVNPEVFINGNVNGLKRGYILRIPDYEEITRVSVEDARYQVIEQNALWREYQQALGVDQPVSAAESAEEAIADEAVESKVAGSGIPSARTGDDAKLSIVSAGGGAGTGEAKDPTEMSAEELREQLAIAREQLETERVQKEGLSGDVDALEDRIEQMQGLLEIQDESMAEIQEVAEGGEAPATAEDAAAEEVAVSEEEAMSALDELEDAGMGAELAAAEEAVAGAEETAATEEVFVDETTAQQPDEEVDVEVAEPAKVDVMPRQQTGLVGTLLGNPLIAGGVALLVLILGAVVYILIKRRRDSSAEEAEAVLAADMEPDFESEIEDIADDIEEPAMDDFLAEEPAEAAPEAEQTQVEAEEEFDTDSTMILPGGIEDTIATSPAAETAAEDDEEADDVIAEADVYLAYGIYQQAEELLTKAISDNPDKHNYRVKLAETYFAAKNSEGLEKLGTEMKQALGGEETPQWLKVAAMGKELCPEAEIFQQAGAVADLDIDELMPKSPEPMDFDLGDAAGGEDAGDLDLDFDAPMEEPAAEPEIPVDETFAIPDAEETMDAIEETGDVSAAVDDLEFDIGETGAVEEAAEDEFSLDIEASELDLDIGDEAPAEAEEESVEIDSAELDFDMGDESPAAEVSAAPAGDADEVDLSDLGDVDEINTKLDLAKAYIDMGDNEGARDILDEVVAGGNDQQKQEAQELLNQVG